MFYFKLKAILCQEGRQKQYAYFSMVVLSADSEFILPGFWVLPLPPPSCPISEALLTSLCLSCLGHKAARDSICLFGYYSIGELMPVKCLRQCWVCCKPPKCVNNIISSSSTPVVLFFTRHSEWSLKLENPFISSDCLKYSGTLPCLKSQIPTSPWPCTGCLYLVPHTHPSLPTPALCCRHAAPLSVSQTHQAPSCCKAFSRAVLPPTSSETSWPTGQLKANSGTQDTICDHPIICAWLLPLHCLMNKWMDFCQSWGSWPCFLYGFYCTNFA